MTTRRTTAAAVFILMAGLLASHLGLKAGEKDDASAGRGGGKAAAAQPKPALELGGLFADHMVLQREMKVPVWGRSKPGTEVTVEFAGQKKTATAGADGKWVATLDPMPASAKGRELRVECHATLETITARDVLVGEVWVCSGQSNMSYDMSRFRNCAEEVPRMKYPMIREFKTFRVSAPTPQEDALGAWAVCSPNTAIVWESRRLELGNTFDGCLGYLLFNGSPQTRTQRQPCSGRSSGRTPPTLDRV